MLSIARQSDSGHIRRGLGLILAVVFLQGFAGTLMHGGIDEHVYCQEHQQITHDSDHVSVDTEADDEAVASATSNSSDESPDDRESTECEWLTWLQTSTSTIAALNPTLLDLPPPSEPAATPVPARHQFAGYPIDRRHVSPTNSPPAV